MKELSIEEKAKAYDKALELARVAAFNGHQSLMEGIFPELKESEDEKIRKEIIDAFKTLGDGKIPVVINYADIFTWLEKQGREKPADNVESKFKVGDWITDDEDEAIFHITSYDIDYGYQLETVNGTSFHYSDETIEKKYRLWTIQDAKDGDVLYCDNGNNKTIYLFKEQRGLSNISNTHFQVLNMNNELRLMFNKAADFNLNTKPATKEQRDLLFQKMYEAGYKWDGEKKELKKIEQKSATMFLDEAIEHCKEKSCGNNACALEHKQLEKWLTELKELKEQKPAWSEEDERMIDNIIFELEENQENISGVGYKIDWLNSLK